jgi:hypothetical protein
MGAYSSPILSVVASWMQRQVWLKPFREMHYNFFRTRFDDHGANNASV